MVSLAVVAADAAIIAADIGAPSASRKDEHMARTYMVVASTATFVAMCRCYRDYRS